MRVLIIGGGLGGLTLANGLLHNCPNNTISIRVFERHPSPSTDLGGYFIHLERQGLHTLLRCLTDHGWQRFLKIATPTGAQWAFRDTHLNLLAMRDDVKISGRGVEEVGRYAVERWELRGILLEDLGAERDEVVQWGREFVRYEHLSDGRGLSVYFKDGTSEGGDVLIGADGSKSLVRAQRFPEMKREDLGVVVVCGRYLLTEGRGERLPGLMTDCSLNNVVPWGQGWVFLSSWRSRQGCGGAVEQRDNKAVDYALWAYFVPKPDMPADVKTMTAVELRDLVLEGVKDWAPPIETVVREADLETISPIFLHSAPHSEKWDASNVTCLGDSIHSMTPAAGVGANTALRDAQILTDLFVKTVQNSNTQEGDGSINVVKDVISEYEAQMRPYANAAVALSKQIAESAASTAVIQRFAFRILLRLAQLVPFVMKATIGRGAVQQ